MTPDLRTSLSATLSKVRADEPAIAALTELPGIGVVLARRIVDHYGPTRALEVVREDPYQLIREIDGIGFEKADAIALAGGLGTDSEQRVEAGVSHAIDLLCNQKGHCYTDRGALVKESTRLLGVGAALSVASLDRLTAQNRVVVEGEAIYTWATHYAEERVAEMLCRINATPARTPTQQTFTLFNTKRLGLEEAAEQAIQAAPFPLADAQQEAVRAVTGKALVITGGPGVGKTTVLRTLADALRLAGLRFRLCAPTGRAAKRMMESTGYQASTIHRMLGLRPGKRPAYHSTNPMPEDVLIVDEMSMVSLDLARKVLDAVPPHARLILIGDMDQLPSISPGAVLRDIIESGVVKTVRLSQVFRQAKGSRISVSAQRINAGERPEGERGQGGEFYIFPATLPRDAADTVVDLVTLKLPRLFGLDPRTEVQVLCPTKKGDDGVDALNARIQTIVNGEGPDLWGFRVGDRVIHTEKNDYGRDVMNGDVGFVVGLGEKSVSVKMDERVVEYDREEAGMLKLAYALSIHKSQGCEFKAVVIPMLGPDVMLSRNMLYTATTRGKGLVVLVSNDNAITRALSETKKENRNTRLAARMRAAA